MSSLAVVINKQMVQEPIQTPSSVVIPAYYEEAAVGPQVEVIRKALTVQGISHEILIIDDGSEDQTAEEALQAGARVFRHPGNRGYGAALKTGAR